MYEVSSFKPIGPLAWSFCVEIPNSFPKPYSPPSAKPVDTLTKIDEASTSFWNFCAATYEEVAIASECALPIEFMCSIAYSIESTIFTEQSNDNHSLL